MPLLGVLDEAANVCRWRELPDLYSHYGSPRDRADDDPAVVVAGRRRVGRAGMRKLWSAANVNVYGGGVCEDEFLEALSQLVGDYDRVLDLDLAPARGQRSVSRQLVAAAHPRRRRAGRLPKGRAIVLASGARRR